MTLQAKAETQPQITGDLPANSAQIAKSAPVPRKSMEGKYDKRKQRVKIITRKRSGRIPLHEKHLSRNTAAKLFRQLNVHDQCLQLLSAPDLRLRFEVIRYLWDRLEGRPFVAINPAEQKQPAVFTDQRLQIAITNLIPGAAKSKKTLRQQVVDVPALTTGDGGTAE